MKKKIWIPIVALVALAAILFVPIPTGTLNDGGTKVYSALTYKIVDWHRMYNDEIYDETRVYFGADAWRSVDELFEDIEEDLENRVTAEIVLINGTHVIIEPVEGEWERESSDLISFDSKGFDDIGAAEGCIVEVSYKGGIMESYPAQIKATGWRMIDDGCEGSRDENASDEDVLVDKKPVIYLYPERETEVSVYLDYDGELTCTYPTYSDGWHVTASPDGTLTDENGQIYNYLYWEGLSDASYDLSKGFCVKGEDTAAFLEGALSELGLTRREANEFIVYWLPMMQENEYNIISFQTDAYTDIARLEITPTPDTLIRVFMAWQASDAYVELAPQELSAPDREGFCAVEWGGVEIG